MVLPALISEASAVDPLLLLPLPKHLPPSPLPDLEPVLLALEPHLSQSPITSSQIPIAVLAAHMRQITRRSQVLLNAARVGAADARDGLDRVDVDLRAVEYERDRVREEIERCEEYSPAYRELDILDVESFRAAVGEEALSALPAEEDESFEFAQTIARLEHELSEIQQREALLAQLTKDRDGLIKSKKEIKAKFDAVDVYLTDFAKTSNAVASKVKDVSSAVKS